MAVWNPGHTIRDARVALGWSLRQLADASGVRGIRVGEIERGVVSPDTPEGHRLMWALLRELGSRKDNRGRLRDLLRSGETLDD